jgi:hypothetical protein
MKNTIVTVALAARLALAAPTSGKFTALSFNVAGLPQILQGNDVPGDKTDNSRQIGAYFAEYDYDLIHMQVCRLAAVLTLFRTTTGSITRASSGTLAPMLLVLTA